MIICSNANCLQISEKPAAGQVQMTGYPLALSYAHSETDQQEQEFMHVKLRLRVKCLLVSVPRGKTVILP